jgi:hypothetical protein
MIEMSMYDDTVPYNLIQLDADGDGFYLPIPAQDMASGVGRGPTLGFDVLNGLDRFSGLAPIIAGLGTAGSVAIGQLTSLPALGQFAAALGTNALELAPLFAYAIINNWQTSNNIMKMLIPSLGNAALSAAAATATANLLPFPKIATWAGAALGGGLNAAGYASMMRIIDDSALGFEF